jgi:hypothetical protein
VIVQDSDDDMTYVDLITFTQASADGAFQRATAAGDVEQYLRSRATVTTGPATFHVSVGRRPSS